MDDQDMQLVERVLYGLATEDPIWGKNYYVFRNWFTDDKKVLAGKWYSNMQKQAADGSPAAQKLVAHVALLKLTGT